MATGIVILDDSEDLRFMLICLLKSVFSEVCLAVGSVRELIAHEPEVLNSHLVILDINLGVNEPNGLDAYNWLKKSNYRGQVFFLTGHGLCHPAVTEACRSGAKVWSKPLLTEELIAAISSVIKPREARA
jgi:FixJ family two-component response regulator